MALKTLLNEVEILTQYPILGLAVSDSDAPIPGYLFGEINALTYVEHGKICKDLVSFLISRLKAKNPFVSFKVLKLLLYLVKNGHQEIIEELHFHEIPLKEAKSFNGPQSNVHGNTYNENIRKMAKELLEIIFAEQRVLHETASHSGQSQMTGYGFSSKDTSHKMLGFGYTVKTQKSVSEVITDGLSKYMDKLLTSDKTTESLQMTQLKQDLPHYKPLVIHSNSFVQNQPILEQQSVPTVPKVQAVQEKTVHIPGRPGGCWDEPDDYEIISKPDNEAMDKEISTLESEVDVQNSLDMSEEYKIVEKFTINKELCDLEYSSILTFCKQCSSLNCDEVLKYIREKFSEKKENVQLRALIFLEYLMFHDIVTLESVNRIIFQSLEQLFDAKNDVKKPVAVKAKKIYLTIKCISKQLQQKLSPLQACSEPQVCSSSVS